MVSPSLIVSMYFAMNLHVGMKPLPIDFPCNPKMLFICEDAIVIEAPAVKPVVTGSEMKLMIKPAKKINLNIVLLKTVT